MVYRMKNYYISPALSGTASLQPEDALLVASGPQVESSYVIEGQEVQNYFEEGDLSNAWD